jgi:hypothetical protein
MRRLPVEALKFEAVRTIAEHDGQQYAALRLLYYLEVAKKKQFLLRIDLEDTEAYNPEGVSRFWFHYQPIVQHLPQIVIGADGAGRPHAAATEPLLRAYPAIDLIVFSSVRVRVFRFLENMRTFQDIGFEGVSADADSAKATFSPTRPKIALHRVHRLKQMPLQGSAFDIQSIRPDFSFYADRELAPQITLRSLADLIRESPDTDQGEQLAPYRTWTRVFFDSEYIEFNFLESSFRLRVYDQGYDRIDEMQVRNDEISDEDQGILNLEDARKRQHTAEFLLSEPKYFDYSLEVDRTRAMLQDPGDPRRVYYVEYRTALTIAKSSNVHLVGTIDRDTRFDQRSNHLFEQLPRSPGQQPKRMNYHDYMPWVGVRDRSGKPLLIDNLERSAPESGYLFQKSASRRYLEFQLSLFIGFTPLLGEAFGLYELYTALSRDEDAFGNKLTDNEKILVCIAAILPLISLKMLQSAADGLGGLADALPHAFPSLSRSASENSADVRRLSSLP